MDKFEEEIEEAAKKYALRDGYHDELYIDENSFRSGAFSEAAKKFHQKGLYTEEEVYEIARKCWRERGIVAQTYNMSTEPLLMVYFDKIKKK